MKKMRKIFEKEIIPAMNRILQNMENKRKKAKKVAQP